MTTVNLQGITETEIADYLVNTPGFFERHAELLASVELTSPHGQRAVSLQERQMEMLRDKNKGLEMRIIEMIRHSQENVSIADRLHRWTLDILLTQNPSDVPEVLVSKLQHQFMIPQAGIRLWGAAEMFQGQPFSRNVSADAQSFANSLALPYCGLNSGFEAAQWLEDPSTITSMALISLRHAPGEPAFGMLVLGSPDPTRFSSDMAVDFLQRIGELASAGLSRLLPPR